MSVFAIVFRMFSFLFADTMMFWMCLQKQTCVRCVSMVMPSIFGVCCLGVWVSCLGRFAGEFLIDGGQW